MASSRPCTCPAVLEACVASTPHPLLPPTAHRPCRACTSLTPITGHARRRHTTCAMLVTLSHELASSAPDGHSHGALDMRARGRRWSTNEQGNDGDRNTSRSPARWTGFWHAGAALLASTRAGRQRMVPPAYPAQLYVICRPNMQALCRGGTAPRQRSDGNVGVLCMNPHSRRQGHRQVDLPRVRRVRRSQ